MKDAAVGPLCSSRHQPTANLVDLEVVVAIAGGLVEAQWGGSVAAGVSPNDEVVRARVFAQS